jgi:hypothetical protein
VLAELRAAGIDDDSDDMEEEDEDDYLSSSDYWWDSTDPGDLNDERFERLQKMKELLAEDLENTEDIRKLNNKEINFLNRNTVVFGDNR